MIDGNIERDNRTRTGEVNRALGTVPKPSEEGSTADYSKAYPRLQEPKRDTTLRPVLTISQPGSIASSPLSQAPPPDENAQCRQDLERGFDIMGVSLVMTALISYLRESSEIGSTHLNWLERVGCPSDRPSFCQGNGMKRHSRLSGVLWVPVALLP